MSAQMVAFIEELIRKGHAYQAEGHVLFSVASDPDYGSLSGRSVDDMIAGARVEVAPYKRDPMDFVLWKPSTSDQPGWDSPWGRGRPGWHIECSAMARDLLGDRFDIHGGGADLMFPHHENEIAQSHSAGDPFANVWLHNEMLQVEGRKMSKSLGNFFTVRDLLEQGWPGEVIRLVFLGTHYRKPMDWTLEKARQAEATLRNWRRKITGFRLQHRDPPNVILRALENDLNTPQAIAELGKFARKGAASDLLAGANLLGLLEPKMGGWDTIENEDELDDLVGDIAAARAKAREEKDYEKADQLRGELSRAGIVVTDYPNGRFEWVALRDHSIEEVRRSKLWSTQPSPRSRDDFAQTERRGPRPTLGGRLPRARRRRFIPQSPDDGGAATDIATRPPGGRVGRGPGWSPAPGQGRSLRLALRPAPRLEARIWAASNPLPDTPVTRAGRGRNRQRALPASPHDRTYNPARVLYGNVQSRVSKCTKTYKRRGSDQ